MNLDSPHLGGHCNRTHLEEGALDYILKKFEIKSMLDIGCGPGGMVDLAIKKGIYAHGIDGDYTLNLNKDFFTVHDYTISPLVLPRNFDLIWCCEFVEHVEEKFMQNYLETFKLGKYILLTYNEGPGYHHVNCKPEIYWITNIEKYGFVYDKGETNNIRNSCTSVGRKAWVRNKGLFFKKQI